MLKPIYIEDTGRERNFRMSRQDYSDGVSLYVMESKFEIAIGASINEALENFIKTCEALTYNIRIELGIKVEELDN